MRQILDGSNTGLNHTGVTQCSRGPVFPRSYVPEDYVPEAHVSKTLCIQGPVFPRSYVPEAHVPKTLCIQGHVFPTSYVPKTLGIQGPVFLRSYVPEALCIQGPVFPRSYVPEAHVPKTLCILLVLTKGWNSFLFVQFSLLVLYSLFLKAVVHIIVTDCLGGASLKSKVWPPSMKT